MKHKAFSCMLAVAMLVPILGYTHAVKKNAVDVRIISDSGVEFPKYRAYPRIRETGAYYYMEAVKGERYSIEVANRTDRRVGVVIAVDGRNIISGQKSDLKNNERMYIISPYTTNTFEGWRTGTDRTNRFYFSEQSDSYAEKVFSDASAMGTIAVAVYREKRPPIALKSEMPYQTQEAPAGSARQATPEKRSYDRAEKEKSEQAGTGFGETTHSPARQVHFEPENVIADKIVFKYEWRQELCKKGIVSCGPGNRFWPDSGGFAPIPRDFNG